MGHWGENIYRVSQEGRGREMIGGKSVRRNVRIKDLFEEEDHRVDKEGKKLIEGC